ncbi:MAG TPA: plastocyanin/azurin family copper-binding protein [Solirubrobacteraceae bacterium]|jgi:plastocyanin
MTCQSTWRAGAACVAAALLLAGCGASETPSKGSSGGGSNASSSSESGSGGSASQAGSGAGASKGKSGKHGGLELDSAKKLQYAKVSPSAPVQSGTVEIAYRNIAIDPDTVKVKVGSTIKWTNYDSVPHNVQSEGGPLKFSSGNFGEGKSYELKVTKPGVIHYECTLEPETMNGTIEVVE